VAVAGPLRHVPLLPLQHVPPCLDHPSTEGREPRNKEPRQEPRVASLPRGNVAEGDELPAIASPGRDHGEQPVGRHLGLVLAGKQHGAAGVDEHHVWGDGLRPNRLAASQAGVPEDRVEDPLVGGGDLLSPDDALAGSIVRGGVLAEEGRVGLAGSGRRPATPNVALSRSWGLTASTHLGLPSTAIAWYRLPARIARQASATLVCTKCRNSLPWGSGSCLGQPGRVAPGRDVVIEQMRTNRNFAGALGPARPRSANAMLACWNRQCWQTGRGDERWCQVRQACVAVASRGHRHQQSETSHCRRTASDPEVASRAVRDMT
jgi:hypothetical protein